MTGSRAPRVWIVYDYDPSHGIAGIFGVYSTEDRAKEEAEKADAQGRVTHGVEIQDWPLDV